MHFIRYNSIENATNKMLYEFKESSLYNPADKWCVTEKIHGSNMAFYADEDGNLVPAKRSSFIGMDSAFFNFQSVVERYGQSIKNIMTDLMLGGHYHVSGDSICDVSIHGELCGGCYAGTDKIPNAKKVQASVEYSNNTEFVVFDIRIYDSEGKYEFLSHKDVTEICTRHSIPVVPIIFEGTLDECMQWSRPRNAYPSEIGQSLFNMPIQPCIKVMDGTESELKNYLEELIAKDQSKKNKAYGLTTVEPDREWDMIEPAEEMIKILAKDLEDPETYTLWEMVNIREGHVLKPYKSMFKGDHRVIFKDKNIWHKENKGSKEKSLKIAPEYSDAMIEVVEDIDSLICRNRFDSVVSKFGDYTIRNFQDLMILMCEDITEELERENEAVFDGFTEIDHSGFRKILAKKISAFFVQNKNDLF